MTFARRLCNLNALSVFLLCFVLRDAESTPCSRFVGSSPAKDRDQIYFPDGSSGFRIIEKNGTVITCDSDGKILSAKKTNKNPLESNDSDDPLNERIDREDGVNSHGAVREVQSRLFVANVSDCAENDQSFCTKSDNYPIQHIRQLIQRFSHDFKDVFSTDLTTNDVTFRIDGVDEEYLCDSYEKVIFPTTGKTQDGKELFIFNTDEHKQGVRVSMCQKRGRPCKMSEIFPSTYRSECKQQMVYRELLSLSPEGEPVKEHFEFPACCSCVLRRMN